MGQLSLLDLPDELVVMIFDWIIDSPGVYVVSQFVCHRIRNIIGGCFRVVQRCLMGAFFTAQVAHVGHWNLITWARANGAPWSDKTCNMAAMGGQLITLKLLRASGCPWSYYTFEAAALGGSIKVIQWLYENGCPRSRAAGPEAAKGGHLCVLEWMEERKIFPDHILVLYAAARAGHLNIVRWLHDKDPERSRQTLACMCAAEGGHLEVLQWLRANGYGWDMRTTDNAAKAGRVELLEWAIANGCPTELDPWVMIAWAKRMSGQLQLARMRDQN